MALSETLYTLRKKSGLSQEQLAEQLGVSRQSISKWESGASVPESEKLIAISRYFHVSLDELVNEQGGSEPQAEKKPPERSQDRARRIAGSAVCIGGVFCLLVWGLLSIFRPAETGLLGASSAVTLNGNGIFLLCCVAAIVLGAVLLLKGTKNL